MIQRIVSLLESPDRTVLLARFSLEGDAVAAEYHDDGFRHVIEGWAVTVADGRAFIDEIDRVYRRSSRILVSDGSVV